MISLILMIVVGFAMAYMSDRDQVFPRLPGDPGDFTWLKEAYRRPRALSFYKCCLVFSWLFAISSLTLLELNDAVAWAVTGYLISQILILHEEVVVLRSRLQHPTRRRFER